MKISFYFCLFLLFFHSYLFSELTPYKINSIYDISRLFPKNCSEMVSLRNHFFNTCENELAEILESIAQKEDPDKTLTLIDGFLNYLSTHRNISQILCLVERDDSLREEATKTQLAIKNFSSDFFSNQREVYFFLKENIFSDKKAIFVQDLLKQFESCGQNLDETKRLKLQETYEKIHILEKEYNQNIIESKNSFLVHKDDLVGVHKRYLKGLKKQDDLIELSYDTPLYLNVMNTCSCEKLRKNYAEERENRAYPQNERVLEDLITERNRLATFLGYPSFAHYKLKDEMSKNPDNVRIFLDQLWENTQNRAYKEIETICNPLPKEISLGQDNKLNTWDSKYTLNTYLRRTYNLNQEEVSAYFPLEKTLKNISKLCHKLFGIQISEAFSPYLWDKNLKLLKVKDFDDKILGYIILDLFSREKKFNQACNISVVSGPVIKGEKQPNLEIIITNFSKTENNLLYYYQVLALLHELGHALHSLFIKNEIYYYSNLENIKLDFVELPSQLFEEWFFEAELLKEISSHYLTHEPMPDHLIKKMKSSKNTFIGNSILSQCFFSTLSLDLFSENKPKEIFPFIKKMQSKLLPFYKHLDNGHFYLSFPHLTEYGPSYYGYLWSLAYSKDVLEAIKKEGLMNPKVALKYRYEILEKGGSEDPYILLENFLGRKPNQEAFIKSLDSK